MKITPVPHGLEDLVGKSGPRTPGLHMSQIYGDLYQDLEPGRFKRDTAPDPLRLEAGLAFESFLEEAFKHRVMHGERPPELTHYEPGVDTPILYNPDLLIFDEHIRVVEIKLSWMSSRELPREVANHLPQKFSKYLCQLQAYCHCLETNLGRLIFFGVNGDYNRDGAFTPLLLAFDFEFTRRELDDNWTLLMAHARLKKML